MYHPAAPIDTLDHIPEGLLERSANQVHEILPRPTLIRLAGARARPVFLTVLQHGNEWTGWDAVRQTLAQMNGLPRSIWLFVANPQAARHGLRRLPGQADMNREWPGTRADTPMAQSLAELTAQARDAEIFADIDLHNTSGRNPPYGATTSLAPQSLALARRFDPRVIYFRVPVGTHSGAFGRFCPAVTLECGMSGTPEGLQRALEFLDWVLRQDDIDVELAHGSIVYQTVARLTVDPATDFNFGEPAPLSLTRDLDALNFCDLPKGFELGTWDGAGRPLLAADAHGDDVTDDFIDYANDRVRLKRSVVPSMLTCDTQIVRQDCLGYLMRQVQI